MSLENTVNTGLISLASTPEEKLAVAEAQYDDSSINSITTQPELGCVIKTGDNANKNSLFADAYKYLQGVLSNTSKWVYDFIDPHSGGLVSYPKTNHSKPYACKRKGFTLTELLTTISATALLMAILMPAFQRVRKQARAVVCQTNLHQLDLTFATDEEILLNIVPPPLSHLWWLGPDWKSFYGNSKDVFLCPMATKLGSHITPTVAIHNPSIWWRGSKFSAWGYKSNNYDEPIVCSYGFNSRLLETRFIKSASSIPMLFDCANLFASLESSHNPPPEYDDIYTPLSPDTLPNADALRAQDICINRHDGFINSSFMDSSTRKVGLKELWTLKWHREFDTAGPWTKAGGVKREDWPKWMRGFKDY